MDKETSVKEWGAAGMNSAMESEAMEECRACLQTIKKHTGYNLFEAWFTPWAVSGAIIADDLSKFADVEISEVDQFSKVICEKCYHRLSDACTFMITVQMSDTTLRERVDNNLKSTKSEVGILWPQPILVNKSGNGDVDNMEVEVKQEVLSEDENASNVDQDWEPTMEIKIEPEEISAPVQSSTQVNGVLPTNEMMALNGPSRKFEQEEYLNNTVKQEPMSGDELLEDIPDLPLDCKLCLKVFSSVSGLKAHVISQHSYGAVKRKAESSPPPVRNKIQIKEYACNSCNQSFATSTDLMVHGASHSEHVCYVCDRKFKSFYQLTRHGPRCQKKCANAARRDQKRPIQLLQPVKTTTKAQEQDIKTEERKTKPESLPIYVISERVQGPVKPLPSIDQMDIESPRKQSENEIKVKAEKTLEEKQIFEIKQEPMKTEIGTAMEKIHESVQEPQTVQIERKVHNKPETGVLEPENRLLEPVTEEMNAENIQQVSQNEPSNENNEAETTEDILSEQTTSNIQSEPITEDILSEPTTEDMLGNPTAEDILSEPTTEDIPTGPTTAVILSKPTAADILNEPTTADFLSETTAVDSLNEPTTADILSEPTNAEILSEPIAVDILKETTSADILSEAASEGILSKQTTADILSESTTGDILTKPTTDEILNEPITDDILNEPTIEDILSDPTRESEIGSLNIDLRRGLSQEPVISPENKPSTSTPEPTTCNFLPNINFDDLLNSESLLDIVEDNILHSDSVPSFPNQGDSKEILTNMLSCDNVKEPTIEPHQLTEEIHSSIRQVNVLGNSSDQNEDNSEAGEGKTPTITDEITPALIDEISEMKVHLEINPLDKVAVLFDAEMEDAECKKSEGCEAKLVSVISEQSDIQQS